MDLSVLIVSWNTRKLLDRCLSSVFETTCNIDTEVIVVDNASSDGSAEMVCSTYPSVRLISNDSNTGFARANNQAIGHSSGKHILLLNPDTICLKGSLEKLVQFLRANPGAGVVAPLVLNPDGSLQHSWARFPTLFLEAMGNLDRRVLSQQANPKTPDETRSLGQFPVDWIGGACFMARRSAIDEVGPLDEDLFMYCEETDWCLRFASAGWQAWVEPDAQIIHLGGQSSRQVPFETRRRLAASKLSLFSKHRGRAQTQALRAAFVGRAVTKAAISGGLAAVRGRESLDECRGQLALARYLMLGGKEWQRK